MNGFRTLAVVAALALSGAAGSANATVIIQFDSIVTGFTPATSVAPWLTAEIVSAEGGVEITFSTTLANPEFITDVYFALASGASCSPGASPTATGPYQFCHQFASNTQWAGPAYTEFFAGYSESSFDVAREGWFAAAHVQGIQPECSGWIGAYGGDTVDNGSGRCEQPSVSVREPATLVLFGLGLIGLGLGFRRRRRF